MDVRSFSFVSCNLVLFDWKFRYCPNFAVLTFSFQTSAVKISQVIYRNINGTSRSPHAMKFACSDTVPCSNIVLNNIELERENGTAETFCNCAMGFDYGIVQPKADCLKSSTCGAIEDGNQKHNQDPIHTELWYLSLIHHQRIHLAMPLMHPEEVIKSQFRQLFVV